jgi:sarcosine oxidase subunit alpha
VTGAPNRLPLSLGECLDRSRTIAFSFEGQGMEGYAGDTIASALAANGRWVLSRSFKFRRPRGILTMAGHDANTLVQLPDEPNVLADLHPIAPGMTVTGQNYDGALDRDRGAWVERLGRFMPVGFYYKAFYRPRGAWKFWEPIIRRRAGLGRVNPVAALGDYDKAYGWHDVIVVGGGPAGMAAALAAAAAGADVLLVEEGSNLGGSLTYARFDAGGEEGRGTCAELSAAVEGTANISCMTGATCQGWFADNWLAVTRGNRMFKLRAREIVIATGSIEQPLIFRNNDLPGIMQGSAAQRLIRQFGVRPGRRAVVATANSDGYGVALDLRDAGVDVAVIVDLRGAVPDCAMSAAARDAGVRVMAGHTVWEGRPGPGKHHVAGAVIAKITGRGECAGSRTVVACDLLCMSPGYAPAAQLACHAGAKLAYDPASHMLSVTGVPKHMAIAGSAAGAFELGAVIVSGRHAGWRAARALGLDPGAEPVIPGDRGASHRSHEWPIFRHPKGKEFVDFDEDLQIKDVFDAVAEGYDHLELLKRYSTAGMGPSQGRHSAVTMARLFAVATGLEIGEVGTTTVRPPVSGEKFAHLAGRSFEPVRHSAMHHRHLDAGAQMMVAELWLRPSHYGAVDEKTACAQAEALNVRTNVGLIDVSTLGGLDIRGPDAAEFLNRIYTFAYVKQPVGRARYVLMCDQTGAVIDDGVACRFGEHHFYVTATTGGAARVYQQMQWWNAQWRLDVDITNATSAYCGVNIAGPNSRQVLARLVDDTDLSAGAFPYLGVRTGTVAGIPARLLRVGFVGELGYEVHVPAGQGEALWDAIMEAGRDEGIRPFGVEAQRLLRLEKGHIIVGQDTDGETIPAEAGMTWAVSRKKPFFVGERAIEIQMRRPLARKLAGFALPNPSDPVPQEGHLVISGGGIAGRVTSAAFSPVLNKVVGLAYVAPLDAEPGRPIGIRIGATRLIEGQVVALPHYDPGNVRQEM